MTTTIHYNTNKLINDFPPEFIESKNERSIKVLNCVLISENYDEENDIKTFYELENFHLHASFVHESNDNPTLDHFATTISKNMKPKIFPQQRRDKSFKIWFSDYAGNKLDFDESYYFTLELELTF